MHAANVVETELEVLCSDTKLGDELYVTGDWISWNLNSAVKLSTTTDTFPKWKGSLCAPFLTGTEYKYFIRHSDGTLSWEILAGSNNRFFNGQRVLRDAFSQFGSEGSDGEFSLIPLGMVGKSQFRVLKASYNNTVVAMKAIPLANPFAVRQATTETKMLETFAECRYIVNGVRSWITEDRTYVILEEYMPNGSLFTALYKQRINLNNIQRLRILMHIAAALDFMHKKGYMHRDIKSPNILLDDSFGAKVCDFGISKKEELLRPCEGAAFSPHSLDGEVRMQIGPAASGSPAWMAPEVFARRAHNKSADIYSLGVVMYEVMEAQYPPKGRLYPEDISSTNILADLMRACLQLDPNRRPSARRIKSELRSLITEICKGVLKENGLPVDYQNIIKVYNNQKSDNPDIKKGETATIALTANGTGSATTIATTSPNSQLTRRTSSPVISARGR